MGQRPSHVELVDVGPRDGLQNDDKILPTETKVSLIRRIAAAGIRRIEVTSFVNPKRVPQMADAEDLLAALRDLSDVQLSGLVLNERGFDRAAATGVLDEVTYAIVATETFSQRNQGSTIAQNVANWRKISDLAKGGGLFRSATIAAAFGCPFEGEVPVSQVVELAGAIAEAGADEISLADTIGVAAPHDVEERFAAVAQAVPGIRLRAHFHNTRNTGYANADAAIRSGVQTLDSSLGGIGGCPFAPGSVGNIATEDLVYMLDRSKVATGASLEGLREASLWLQEQLGRKLPSLVKEVSAFPRSGETSRELV
ncbi:hydroxymethylglutaryl-CoA lyase [Novosphingobium pentaromativorans]|uniref:Pyruvate carboxyltransferase n=1 Tax=Novosphingobium pentaromativorans US6-1 TaxID=1088721 RepID=G6EGJ7_9SPHN|nr:hydroxymethylglutaryl-CoA lyase [Novosphingobium pentaromativorans]AIT82171.1 3-hydroxy-3-methylglutaryl-CoA lyase [Novosphingobium pentaromativorans US6-1]EHJ59544.1 pyruvate carboxyltransferase [Novosphingobium pentaromativorans US6-1]